MLLTAAEDIPTGANWLYEPKYDGFRCLLVWKKKTPILTSRTGKNLNQQFPEIIKFCHQLYEQISPFLPLTLDGELVYLINPFYSDFSIIQLRGRMRNEDVITKHAQLFPCHYVVFDVLKLSGTLQTDLPLLKRKQELQSLFTKLRLPLSINNEERKLIQAIESCQDSNILWKKIVLNNGEGVVAKKKTSKWDSGKRTDHWVKIKNWRYVSVLLTKYDRSNGYFHGAIYKGMDVVEVVTFHHGLKEEEEKTLITLFQTNGTKKTENIWELEPLICVDIACINFDGKQLREPRFHAFNFEKEPTDCDWQQMQRQLFPLPETIQITHPDKPIWPKLDIQKDDYLLYLQTVSPYLLPFLRERLLTVIRYPHGATGEHFYQKHCPDYAPPFITTEQVDDIDYIVCNDIETLLWLGNQLALEFHIPFQQRTTTNPTEIVFDLDPPSVKEFSLAIEAAIRMKAIFDQFQLPSFVKTSGGKGLQLYIPIPENMFSYEDTRLFTEFVCRFLCEQEPQWFTTERLKKNRHNKLYLDYIQHDAGKTIIAPYSPRGNEQGLIATPLYWDEVNDSLKPDLFSISAVLDRIKRKGNPFRGIHHIEDKHGFTNVLLQLKELMQKT